MLILALAAQFPVPVGDTQIIVDQSIAHVAVSQHCVKERLKTRQRGITRYTLRDTALNVYSSLPCQLNKINMEYHINRLMNV